MDKKTNKKIVTELEDLLTEKMRIEIDEENDIKIIDFNLDLIHYFICADVKIIADKYDVQMYISAKNNKPYIQLHK